VSFCQTLTAGSFAFSEAVLKLRLLIVRKAHEQCLKLLVVEQSSASAGAAGRMASSSMNCAGWDVAVGGP